MQLVTVNTGSTSVKLALYSSAPGGALRRLGAETHAVGEGSAPELLRRFLAHCNGAPDALVHRVVHGGTRFSKPTRLDDGALAQLIGLNPLAPLHNPKAIEWIEAARALCAPQVVQIAVFDTAFFAPLPRVASEYALPHAIGVDRGVRRYGFHGLAHESLWRGWCARVPGLVHGGRLITLQLGGGCSAAALKEGQPLDTTMGFSPLEGLVMATRCGDLDAAAVPYLQAQLKASAEDVLQLLESQSGLLGVAGRAADPGTLARSADPQERFAVELYAYRIRKYLGAFMAVLGGCDGIVFGGGVGEHVPEVRSAALQGLEAFGVVLDAALNAGALGGAALISAAHSKVAVWAMPSDEESLMAEFGAALLGGPARG
jgi:acetate kinase